MIDATFYLFGFIFFLTSPIVFMPLASSSAPGWTFLRNLSFYVAFAANVFFVLHSDGLRALSALRLNTQDIAYQQVRHADSLFLD